MDVDEDMTEQEGDHNTSMSAVEFKSKDESGSEYEEDINRDFSNVSDEDICPSFTASSNNDNCIESTPFNEVCLSESLSSLSVTPHRIKIRHSLARLHDKVLLSVNLLSLLGRCKCQKNQ